MRKALVIAITLTLSSSQAYAWTQCFGKDYHTDPEQAVVEAKQDAVDECRSEGGTALKPSLLSLEKVAEWDATAASYEQFVDSLELAKNDAKYYGPKPKGAFWPKAMYGEGGGGIGPGYVLWEARAQAVCLDVVTCNLP